MCIPIVITQAPLFKCWVGPEGDEDLRGERVGAVIVPAGDADNREGQSHVIVATPPVVREMASNLLLEGRQIAKFCALTASLLAELFNPDPQFRVW